MSKLQTIKAMYPEDFEFVSMEPYGGIVLDDAIVGVDQASQRLIYSAGRMVEVLVDNGLELKDAIYIVEEDLREVPFDDYIVGDFDFFD
jgi:hypothetical protein